MTKAKDELMEFKIRFTKYLIQSKDYRIEDENPNSDNSDEYRIVKAIDEKNSSYIVYVLFGKGDKAIHNAYEPLSKAICDIIIKKGKDSKISARVVYPNISTSQKTEASFFMDPIVYDGRQWIDFYTNEIYV